MPRASGTGITAINNAGQMLLVSSLGPFLLSGGVYMPLNLPGSPRGLNDADQIVGTSDDDTYGFVLGDGVLTTFSVPGSTFMRAFAINDAGQILGDFLDADGREHGFLATPVPEPSTFLLLGIGTLGVIGICWSGFFVCIASRTALD